jgi:predicted nucleic acid-binding protein
MTQIFADTSYWIALLNPRDELHDKAVKVTRKVSPGQIVTSEMILTELLNSFSDGGPRVRRAVASAVDALRIKQDVRVIPQTAEQFEGALRRYKKTADKSWSLTDCASFAIMETEHIQAALTHDRHFAQAGFDTLLR